MPDSAKNNRKKKGMVSMAMKSGEYEKMAQKASPPTKKLKNGISAFGIGGLICTLGEGLSIQHCILCRCRYNCTYNGLCKFNRLPCHGIQKRGQNTRHGCKYVQNCRSRACLRHSCGGNLRNYILDFYGLTAKKFQSTFTFSTNCDSTKKQAESKPLCRIAKS